jgi:type IV secretory pathway TrbD component
MFEEDDMARRQGVVPTGQAADDTPGHRPQGSLLRWISVVLWILIACVLAVLGSSARDPVFFAGFLAASAVGFVCRWWLERAVAMRIRAGGSSVGRWLADPRVVRSVTVALQLIALRLLIGCILLVNDVFNPFGLFDVHVPREIWNAWGLLPGLLAGLAVGAPREGPRRIGRRSDARWTLSGSGWDT